MSEKLRQLEQRWRETNQPVDEAKYLRERVRTKDLSQKRLALATFLGHRAGRIVFGGSAPPLEDDLGVWIKGFDRWGKEPLLRATIAAARFALPLWNAKRAGRDLPLKAISAAEAWVLCPCDEHAESAQKAAEAVEAEEASEEAEDGDAGGQTFDADMEVHMAANMAAEAAHLAADMGEAEDIAQAVQTAELVLNASRKASGIQLQGTVREAIRDELVPWALGYSDPLSARTEA